MKQAYVYARFSSDNQREESITAQLRAIHEYCDTHDIRILQEFKDEAVSARTDKRPEFQRLFGLIKESPADMLIVHKLDRFARNRMDAAFYRSKLKEAKMKLVSVLEPLDDSPESIIMEGLLESMSEYYSANLSREAKKGLHENIYNGKRNGGKAPLGYRVENQHLVPGEDAWKVRKVFEMYADGASYKEMEAFSGYPHANIRNMLYNEVYLGHLIFGPVRHDNAHEAIVDMETWTRCKKRLASANGNAANRAKVNYMLSRLLVCGLCGKTMIGVSSNGRLYYTCRTKGCKMHRKADLEKRVIDQLAKHLSPTEDLKARIFDLVSAKVNTRAGVEKAKLERSKASQRISRLQLALEYATDPEDVRYYTERIRQIREQMPEIPDELPGFSKERTDAFCDRFFDLKKKTPEEQKIILHRALCKIVVYEDRLDLFTDLHGEVYFSVNNAGIK